MLIKRISSALQTGDHARFWLDRNSDLAEDMSIPHSRCCARAASGKDAAATPSSVMKSRRLIDALGLTMAP
jgi:hypothetical protein